MVSISIGWAGVGVIVAVIGHALFTVWSAASFKTTISVKIDNLVLALQRLDKELEKRDSQIQAAWKKIDKLSERVTRIEAHNGFDKHEEGS